jgi:endoglycosylceramidase
MNTRVLLRKISLNLVAGLATVGLCACSSSSVPVAANGSPIAVPQKLSSNGRWFTDEQGRVVIIHGTNMINKFPPYYPAALGFGDKDLSFLAQNGFNGIRLGFIWAGVEPIPGQYDDVYIDHMAALAAQVEHYGLVPLMDFHQDAYSEKFSGEGAPAWATIDYGVPVIPLPAPLNLFGGGSLAIDNFWMNTKASDGIGLEDHYAAAWKHVVQRLQHDPHIVFELANEPYPTLADAGVCATPVGCPEFDTGALAALYVKILQAIRPIDPDRLIFVEPTGFFGLLQAHTWLPSMNDPQVAFAFHDYCAPGLYGAPVAAVCDPLMSLGLTNAQSHFDSTGEPGLLDEFGAGDSDDNTAYLLDQADQQMLSWMHWAYWAQDFGKVSTYGLSNDLKKAPEGDNIKQGLLTVLSRPSPRLIAGTPQSWHWNASDSTFTAVYSTARVDGSGSFATNAVSTFFVHPRFYPNGYQVQVTGGKVVSAANAAWLQIASLAGAGTITLSITPSAAR